MLTSSSGLTHIWQSCLSKSAHDACERHGKNILEEHVLTYRFNPATRQVSEESQRKILNRCSERLQIESLLGLSGCHQSKHLLLRSCTVCSSGSSLICMSTPNTKR